MYLPWVTHVVNIWQNVLSFRKSFEKRFHFVRKSFRTNIHYEIGGCIMYLYLNTLITYLKWKPCESGFTLAQYPFKNKWMQRYFVQFMHSISGVPLSFHVVSLCVRYTFISLLVNSMAHENIKMRFKLERSKKLCMILPGAPTNMD